MDILYVTSFGVDMYNATGVHLVESFLNSHSDGELLCSYEGHINDMSQMTHDKVRCFDLSKSEFLQTWLYENRDIIPVGLGGEAQPCRCESPADPWSPHREGCPYGWFNKNASRWFRKIVTLEIAMSTGADAIVWVDSDCRFKNKLLSDLWCSLFSEHSVLYHKTPAREVIESGVIAFKMDSLGTQFLNDVIAAYRNGQFRNERRWDDGYIFQRIIELHPEVPSRDLATGCGVDHVLPSSPLGGYIEHYKGVHGFVLRLMR
jgi:hypothetical protein